MRTVLYLHVNNTGSLTPWCLKYLLLCRAVAGPGWKTMSHLLAWSVSPRNSHERHGKLLIERQTKAIVLIIFQKTTCNFIFERRVNSWWHRVEKGIHTGIRTFSRSRVYLGERKLQIQTGQFVGICFNQ